MDWNSAQYLKFQGERTLPSFDLARRIPVREPKKVLDLGCGPGTSTAVLQSVFPKAEILGIDNSQDMLEKARSSYPSLSFAEVDIEHDLSSLGAGYDVVFSNACLQWVPDHESLLPRLLSLLQSGGVLAVQMPMTKGIPLFEIIDEVTADPKWGFAPLGLRVCTVLSSDEYYDILSGCASDFSIWETTYYHRMKNRGALLEWVRGTRLRPFLRVLDPEAVPLFEKEIMDRAGPYYPEKKDGEILFRFNRFFFTATR